MPLISVIIPVFNNSKQDINRCISSLYSEAFKDIVEIILVDDGSSAECAKEIDEIILHYPIIKVFHQANKGVSNARNKGIVFASGEYVAFVDADDVVTKNFISDAIDLIKIPNKKYDIIYGFVKYVNNIADKKAFEKVETQNKQPERIILTAEKKESLSCHFFDISVSEFLWNGYYISRGPVARLIKTDLVRLHIFNEILTIGEDAIWNLELLNSAENICYVKRLWYYYICNPKSATQQLSNKNIEQYENMIWEYTKYANNKRRKACLLNRTIQASTELARGYYLKSDDFDNIFVASREFNKLFTREPWKITMHFLYAYQAGIKCIIKYILIKMGVFLFAIKFNRK